VACPYEPPWHRAGVLAALEDRNAGRKRDFVSIDTLYEAPAADAPAWLRVSNLPESIEYIRTGKLRPLAVTTARRSEVLPDIPTVGDFVPGYETNNWWGVGAPGKLWPRSSINSTQRLPRCSPIPR
jgi:hypothetical protein